MFNIILVDDEYWTLVGLRKLIERESACFKVVYETSNPFDALDKIKELSPDAVFTDIRMPELNGEKLIETCRSNGCTAEFVVISGFAEFDYVNSALKNGALDYILKPVDIDTMTNLLNKLYKILTLKTTRRDSELMRRLYDLQTCSEETVEEIFRGQMYAYIQIAIIKWQNECKPEFDFDGIPSSKCVKLYPDGCTCVCIINSADDITQQITELFRKCPQQFRAGISCSSMGHNVIPKLLREAETALKNIFIQPDAKVFAYRRPDYELTDTIETQIETLLNARAFDKLGELFEKIPEFFVRNELGIHDAAYFYARQVLRSAQRPDGAFIEDLVEFELPERFADISEMAGYLYSVYAPESADNSNPVNGKFFELIEYIDNHYADNLRLNELCSKFYINIGYCCVLFKRYKNSTFSNYINTLRIQKACEAIKSGVSVMSDIYHIVGFKDYYYFSKVFKKITGLTPTEYRKQVKDEENNAM